MEKLIMGEHIFEIVDFVPYGYKIWNIGKNMIDGYLPLVQAGGYDGCQVNTQTMKAIKIEGAQKILAAIGNGQQTISDMEKYIEKHSNSNNEYKRSQVERMKEALPIMYCIKWNN